jgi:hypothetical protein
VATIATNSILSLSRPAGWYRQTIIQAPQDLSGNNVGGTLWGGFNGPTTHDSRLGLAIGVCLPSRACWMAIAFLGLPVLIYAEASTTFATYTSITRNGLTSTAYGSYVGNRITRVVYYDPFLGKLREINPFTSATPFDRSTPFS